MIAIYLIGFVINLSVFFLFENELNTKERFSNYYIPIALFASTLSFVLWIIIAVSIITLYLRNKNDKTR